MFALIKGATNGNQRCGSFNPERDRGCPRTHPIAHNGYVAALKEDTVCFAASG